MSKKMKMLGMMCCLILMAMLSPMTARAMSWHNWSETVNEGDTYTLNDVWLAGFSREVVFENNGTVDSIKGFVIYDDNATFINNGTFHFKGSSDPYSTFGIHAGKFVNRGIVKVDDCHNFCIDSGNFINEGTLIFKNVAGVNFDHLENSGIVVYEPDVSEEWIKTLEEKSTDSAKLMNDLQYESYKESQAPPEYKITYDLNGGSWKEEPGKSDPMYTCTRGDVIYIGEEVTGMETNPHAVNKKIAPRSGYKFAGWIREENDNPNRLIEIKGCTTDIALTAVWEPCEYRVSCNLDGGSFTDAEILDGLKIEYLEDGTPYITYNVESTFTLPTPARPGYTFKGWRSEGGSVFDGSLTIDAGTTGNLKYTAEWTADGDTPYKIQVYYMGTDGQYGSPEVHEATGTTGAEITIPEDNYKKPGFTLDESKGANTGTIEGNGNLILSLYYKRNQYTITFKDYKGEETIAEKTGYYKAPVELPDDPSYEEEGFTYTFTGWAEKPGADTGETALGDIAGDRTYYAAFTPDFYVITLEKLDGFQEAAGIPREDKVKKDGKYELTLTLENENYYFGTARWDYSFQELGVVYSVGPGGLFQDKGDYSISYNENTGTAVLTIPKVERDLKITAIASYHDEHDFSEAYDTVRKEANCAEKGSVRHFCYKCGAEEEAETPEDPTNHKKLIKTNAKPATYQEEGNIEYYCCDGCKKYFRDAAGSEEIEYKDTIIEKLKEEKPDTPNTPDTPDAPDTPSIPDTPDTPDTPSTPDTPDIPDTPNTPDVPDQPAGTVTNNVTDASVLINNKAAVFLSNGRLKVLWSKVSGASGYDIYAAKCGSSFKLVKSVKGTGTALQTISKIGKKKISNKETYKVRINAYRMVNGKKKIIARSMPLHVAGQNRKGYTNAKNVRVADADITLKQGKTKKIRATITKQNPLKKLLSKTHAATYRYYSTNEKVAAVSKSGIIKAKGKGSCIVYVMAANGVKKGIKVKVTK